MLLRQFVTRSKLAEVPDHFRNPIFKQNDPFMLPNFDITLNVYVLLLLIACAIMVGALPRKRQIARKQRKIHELEREMIQAHAEVLESQREYCKLEARVKGVNNSVIPMKSNKLEENSRHTGTD